eukprot:jgi/Orpsp1_1/1188406/evm.model.d7180000064526.1
MSFVKPAQVQLPVSTPSVDTDELMKNCQQGSSLETLLASLYSSVTNLDNSLNVSGLSWKVLGVRLRQRLAELESRSNQPMFESMSVFQTQQSISELELPSSSRSEIKGKKPSVGLSLTRSDLRNSRSTEYDSEGDVVMKDKPLPPDLEFPDFDEEVEDVEYFAKRCRLPFKTQPQYFENDE